MQHIGTWQMDVLFARDPFLADSITVLHMCEDDFAEAVVSVKTRCRPFARKKKAAA